MTEDCSRILVKSLTLPVMATPVCLAGIIPEKRWGEVVVQVLRGHGEVEGVGHVCC